MQLTPTGRRRLIRLFIVIVILNALTTLWLAKTVIDQSNRLAALERNDKITQSVQRLNTKVDSLKSRVEGLFR
jgi:cell division protein FtsB